MQRSASRHLPLLCLLSLFTIHGSLAADSSSLLSDAALKVLTSAENLYPELFINGGELKQTQGYTYRFYSGTGVYVGFRDDQVFLLGGPFGTSIVSKGPVAGVQNQLEGVKTKRTSAARQLLQSTVNTNWNSHGAATVGPVRLTHLPMNLADIGSIVPQGLLAGGHVTPVDHVYFYPVVFNSAPGTYPVYIVANGVLSEISTRPNNQGNGLEYRVVLQHTGTYYSYYDLLDELDPAIASQIPAGALDNGKLYRGPITVNAGQLLGRIGGKTLDFANVDLETFLTGYVNPLSYLREQWKLFTVDTFAAFDEPLRGQLLAKNQRLAAPRGGKIDFDVEGSLAGNWFRSGSNGYAGLQNDKPYWAGHLAVVPYVLDPAYIMVSLGEFNGEAKQFGARPNSPDPATITKESGIIKWELTQAPNGPPPLPDMSNAQGYGTVLFQVMAGNQLKVELFPGQTPDKVNGFTSAAEIYIR